MDTLIQILGYTVMAMAVCYGAWQGFKIIERYLRPPKSGSGRVIKMHFNGGA